MRIFVIGYPRALGGANTELWDTLKLWRSAGLNVTLIPTWGEKAADEPGMRRLKRLGVRVRFTDPTDLLDVKGVAGSICVSFCNSRFLERAHEFQALGCPIVWVGCMCWQFPQERHHQQNYDLFDRYVFQSHYQRDQITPHLQKYGWRTQRYIENATGGQEQHCSDDPRGVVIHGAFDFENFPFEPLEFDGRLTIGRISRGNSTDKYPHGDKYMRLWDQYAQTPHPFSARVLGWSRDAEDLQGKPPMWAKVLHESEESPQTFYKSLHAMVPGIGCCPENWPRVGLEAMAAGVPIVAENKGGWVEMLAEPTLPELGWQVSPGVLVDRIDEQAYQIAKLGWEPKYREAVIECQRQRLAHIADPERIWNQWKMMLNSLA